MAILGMLIASAAGGVVASVLDRQYADKSIQVGPITVTPGAMAAGAGIALGIAGVPLPTPVKQAIAGATICELTKVGEQQVLPLAERMFPGLLGAPAAPPPAVTAGEDFVGSVEDTAWMATGIPNTNHDVQSAILAYRMAS